MSKPVGLYEATCPDCDALIEVPVLSRGTYAPASFRGNPDMWSPDESEPPELDTPEYCPACAKPLGRDFNDRCVVRYEEQLREEALDREYD